MLALLLDVRAAGSGENPVAAVLLALAIMLVAAKLGGDLVMRAGQPAVLGEARG